MADRRNLELSRVDELLIFTHIPKAAGSTLTGFLRAQFRRGEMLDVTPIARAGLPERMRTLPPQTRLIAGHASYGLHRHTERPCRYFTVLREPVARVVSAYRYVLKNPAHVWHARLHAERVTLGQFAQEQTDIQTKYLAGFARLKDAAGPDDLARAMETLESGYSAFGLVERFNESLVLLARTFGWPSRGYVSQNVGRSGGESSIESADLAALREANQLDQQLYDRAQSLLEARISAQPPEFAARVAQLQQNLGRANARPPILARLRSLLWRPAA